MTDLQIIKLGDTAQRVEDQLLIDDVEEIPADLTDAEVLLHFRHVASTVSVERVATVIPPATEGNVEYQWTVDDGTTLGDYICDWEVNFPDGRTLTFPNEGYNLFRVIAPVGDGELFTPIASFRDWVRSYLLDNHPLIKQWHADQIDLAIKMAVQMLRARGQVSDLSLSSDGASIIPAITFDDPVYGKAWALVVLHAAKRFISDGSTTQSYRTRALSETFGGNREQVFDLLNEVYELENGEGGM